MTSNEYTNVKPSDKLIVIAPQSITMSHLNTLSDSILEFKRGVVNTLILNHDIKLAAVDKEADIELQYEPATKLLKDTINDLTLSLSMWHAKYPFDEDHIYKQKIMINNASILIGKPRTEDEMKVMIDRTPDNIMLTAEKQWASELFEELCTIEPESTPIDASEPGTERHPAVESLISQLSVILYGDENE